MKREIKFRVWHKRHGMSWEGEEFTLDSFWEQGMFHGSPLKDFEYDEFIFMQYTGIKGKRKKEIYEGDIISRHGKTQVVEWIGGINQDFQGFDLSSVFGVWEVIGNIYENPELK